MTSMRGTVVSGLSERALLLGASHIGCDWIPAVLRKHPARFALAEHPLFILHHVNLLWQLSCIWCGFAQ